MSAASREIGFDRDRELMMRALDGEISPEQRAELEDRLSADDSLRAEWKRLSRVKERTAELELEQPPDKLWEEYMNSVYRRVERGIAWILLSLGAVVLLSYWAWQGIGELMGDLTLPWYVKAGALAALVGIVVLAVSVIREKYFVYKDDPFRNVHR